MTEQVERQVTRLELPQIAPDEEFIEKIKGLIKEGGTVEMFSSGAQMEIPSNMGMTAATFIYTREPASISISRGNTTDRNSNWKLTIGPPATENK
jgi:hypothetical protein